MISLALGWAELPIALECLAKYCTDSNGEESFAD